MALAPGARLGPYEIASAIGAGGMGEVYRAKDVRLDRSVAVKSRDLGAHQHEVTGFRGRQSHEQGGNQRLEVRQTVASRVKHNDHNGPPPQVLLKWKTLVQGDQRRILVHAGVEQGSIVEVGPAPLMDTVRLVSNQQPRKPSRQVRVQQDAHDRGYAAGAGATSARFAISSTATACSRVTLGNSSRNTSSVSPASRYSIRDWTGTRVPANTGVPPSRLGDAVMRGSGSDIRILPESNTPVLRRALAAGVRATTGLLRETRAAPPAPINVVLTWSSGVKK